jgi:lysozyme
MIVGIDISHYQGDVDWAKIKADGVSFAWAKATQGNYLVDSRWTEGRHKAAIEAGIHFGGYHFADLGQDPVLNAKNFLKAIGSLRAGDLLPMVDVEDSGLPDGITIKKVNDWLVAFSTEFNRHIKTPLVMYCGVGKYAGRAGAMSAEVVALFPHLWLYRYTNASDPGGTGLWPSWDVWQHSSSGHINGISGNVDMDRIQTEAVLYGLTVHSDILYGPGE